MDSRSAPGGERGKWTGPVGAGVDPGARLGQRAEWICMAEGPLLVSSLGHKDSLSQMSWLTQQVVSISLAATGWSDGVLALARPCRAIAGHVWGQTKGRGQERRRKKEVREQGGYRGRHCLYLWFLILKGQILP